MASKWLNVMGLLFGIAGVIVIFRWGSPQPSFELRASIGLEENTTLADGKTVAENNADVEAQKKQHEFMSRIGLGMIGVGFVLQLLSQWP
jgi:hypothetical protein